MKTLITAVSVSLLAAASLPGCSTSRQDQAPLLLAERQADHSPYGVVQSVEEVVQPGKRGPGAGAVLGGVVGGVLGNQVGKGDGNTAATIVGVVGGAVVGDKLDDRHKERVAYRVSVRMDDGSYQAITQDSANFRRGDVVAVRDGRVWRR
ncbi:glycine zipper 2TM domain-containing protein [Chitinimonas arctica]|nr:glycine zipper 2TM domain-containing protein [Chitinimonas arctica]